MGENANPYSGNPLEIPARGTCHEALSADMSGCMAHGMTTDTRDRLTQQEYDVYAHKECGEPAYSIERVYLMPYDDLAEYKECLREVWAGFEGRGGSIIRDVVTMVTQR